MPLRALLDGTDIIAPLLTMEEWKTLRQDVRTRKRIPVLPCCGAQAYGRTSPRGLQHFCHPPQTACERSGETTEHLYAKYDILQACLERGYEASTEWDEGPWRADVLARDGHRRVAFEVQWTRQSLDGLIERQERYRRSGVRGCWLVRRAPDELIRSGFSDLKARRDLPLFEMEWSGEGFEVRLNGRQYPLGDFVGALLGGKVAFRAKATVTQRSSISVGFYTCRCWRCAGNVQVYRVLHRRYDAVTACGARLHWSVGRPEPCAGEVEPEFHPRIRSLVAEFTRSDATEKLRISLGSRTSRDGMHPRRALSFACPGCGATFRTLDLRRRADRVVTLPAGCREGVELEWPHWCYSEAGGMSAESQRLSSK
jgi:Competence protein CoiA-like family